MPKLNVFGKPLVQKLVANVPALLMLFIITCSFILQIQVNANLRHQYPTSSRFDDVTSTLENISVKDYTMNGQLWRQIDATLASYYQEKWTLIDAEILFIKNNPPESLQLEFFSANQAMIDSSLNREIFLSGKATLDRLETNMPLPTLYKMCGSSVKECMYQTNTQRIKDFTLRVRTDTLKFSPHLVVGESS